ncbi:MAG: integrase [Rhodanobacter sp.]|nr:MAG: integrase [Rhodanobacter sp.]
MNAVTPWTAQVAAYLVYRRRHGFALTIAQTQLRSFACFADHAGPAQHLTVSLACAWARTARQANPFTWGRRLDVLRGFARYCLRTDPATELLPRGLFGSTHRRRVPHIFTEAELAALIRAAGRLSPANGLRPATCQCVLGLLAATGLRISEALGLTRADVDLQEGVLHIREAKFHQERLVPLHPQVTAHLKTYADLRDAHLPHTTNTRFFLRDDGCAANQPGMLYALQTVCRQLGWQPRGDYPYHRLHDLRHTFIVRALLRFYQQGADVDCKILALSTYVGHAKVSDTYWYLTGIPELMAIAAARFERYAQGEVQP